MKSLGTVILGSATVASVLGKMGNGYTLAAGALTTFLSAVDLVVGTSKAARMHSDLAGRFIELEQKLIPDSSRTRESLDDLEKARLSIEKDEPTILRVLDSICHNELLKAKGYEEILQVRISPLQRFFAHVVDIRPHTIKAPDGSVSTTNQLLLR